MNKVEKCIFEKDTDGVYITPLLGYSNVKGKRSVWIGWLRWLITLKINNKKKKVSEK